MGTMLLPKINSEIIYMYISYIKRNQVNAEGRALASANATGLQAN